MNYSFRRHNLRFPNFKVKRFCKSFYPQNGLQNRFTKAQIMPVGSVIETPRLKTDADRLIRNQFHRQGQVLCKVFSHFLNIFVIFFIIPGDIGFAPSFMIFFKSLDKIKQTFRGT